MIPPSRVALALALTFPSVLGANIQVPSLTLPPSATAHRDAVVQIFNTSYQNYKKFAFGHDDLTPLSSGYQDDRNGWGATIVDALDTMYIMGLNDLFEEAVDFTSKIDFSRSQTSDTVSVFETTIRYLGGMLSAYELSGGKYDSLLQQARKLADKLSFAWINNNELPHRQMDFSSNQPTIQSSNIAEAGTLALEWATLSKHLNDDKYANLALKAFRRIANNPAPLPGLAPQGIDPTSGNPIGGYITWGGGSDSYFEYLIKYARLFNPDDNLYADTWHTAVDSSIRALKKTSTVGKHVYLADYDSQRRVRYVSSHLACFHGGNWIMGGKMLNNDTIVNIGLDLTEACWNTYASTATGLGPEAFAYASAEGNFTGDNPPSPDQIGFYDKHGFYITSSYYVQRPEVLESNFYAWRATGDTKYLDRAAAAIDSMNKYLTVTNGYTSIDDVNNVSTTKLDETESFWFAETLKYLYLTFDDPQHISLDDYVFNTECHPFKAPSAQDSYGTKKLRPATTFKVSTGPPLPEISPIPGVPPVFTPPQLEPELFVKPN